VRPLSPPPPTLVYPILIVTFRLHVKIYDTANQQFTIPESVIERPAAPTTSYTGSSDLVFNYDAMPFAFWITRRSDPDAMPLFDTRTSSLPPTPIQPFNASDPSTAFDSFSLVFEDQYLQVCVPHSVAALGLWSPGCFRSAVWHKHLWIG
jgi:alpha-glucosidase